MTIEVEIPYNEFSAFNDKEFQLDFFIYDKENIKVTLNGNEVPKSLYYVQVNTLESNNGGKVIFYSSITGAVVITRVTPRARTLGYSNALNNINPSNLNYDFDRIYRIMQEQDLAIKKSTLDLNPVDAYARYHIRQFKYDTNTWTEAFRDAIDTVHSVGGGSIFIPAGTYLLEQIEMKSYVCLIGEGSDNTILKQIIGSNKDFVVGEDIESVTLKTLRLDGNYLSGDWRDGNTTVLNSAGGGINWSANAWILDDVTIVNVAGIGLLSRPRSIPQTQNTLQVTNIKGIVGICGKEGVIIRGGYGAGNGDWLIEQLFVGLCGLLPKDQASTQIAMSEYYPGEPCDGVVLHRTNVEIGLIHTYANWSGCGFRTRDICRLTKGGVVISESNRSQVVIDEGAYGSARFDIRYLGTVHPNWTGVLPVYTQPMPEFDGVTINANKRFQCDITVRRIQQPSPRVVGVTAVVLNNSASIKVTCSSTVAGWSGDPEYQEFLSGDAILYTGDGGTIDADVTECNGHALNIQGSTANINFSVTANKSGGAALYRNSLGNSRFGNIITGTIHRCKLGFESVGTPAIEQINLSMIMTGNDEVVFVGDPPSFIRDSLWRINAAISDDGLQTLSTQKSFTFNLVPNTTSPQTVTIPHGYLYEPNSRQVIFSLEDRATPTTAVLEYLYLNDITETDLVFAYKYKTTDMSPAANTRVNVFISQSGGGVGNSVLTNTNTGVDDSGNIIDYLNIFNQSLI